MNNKGGVVLLVVLCAACLARGQSRRVAITFDDLPVADQKDPAQAQAINSAILAALDRHHVPATGFVIGKRISEIGEEPGTRILQDWLRHGQELGNHSFSHPDLNALTVEQFEQDVSADEVILKPLLAKAGRTLRYFRFPQNHTGDTLEKHDAVAAFLKQHGYKVATCTIDNEDFRFDRAYLLMLARGDQASATRLQQEYLTYTSEEIDYYDGLHKQIFGREIPQVMLLHANRLNADLIEQLLAMFEKKHYRFVTLAEAQSDAAYRTPETRPTSSGYMWAYRWAKELGVKVNGSLEKEPPQWIFRYGQ